MSTVAVKPKLIQWAVRRSGIPVAKLQRQFPKLEDWRSGKSQPTFRQLESFAKATMTPFGAMFLDSPPTESLPLPDFRTKGDKPVVKYSPNLIDTIHEMERRQAWMKEWLLEEGAVELDFIGSAKQTESVMKLAARMKERLGLADNWAEQFRSWEDAGQHLKSAVENIGVMVFSNGIVGLNTHRSLDLNEFRGLVMCDPIAPLIFVNSADSISARNFTLAHELAHLWLGKDAIFNLERLNPSKQKQEVYCNQVAAEFLVPEAKLRERWVNGSGAESTFRQLSKVFRASPLAIARRALDLNLITKQMFFSFYKEVQHNWADQVSSGGDFYVTQRARLGTRFSEAIVRATLQGRTVYQEAYRLTGMKVSTFQKYAEMILKEEEVVA